MEKRTRFGRTGTASAIAAIISITMISNGTVLADITGFVDLVR